MPQRMGEAGLAFFCSRLTRIKEVLIAFLPPRGRGIEGVGFLLPRKVEVHQIH